MCKFVCFFGVLVALQWSSNASAEFDTSHSRIEGQEIYSSSYPIRLPRDSAHGRGPPGGNGPPGQQGRPGNNPPGQNRPGKKCRGNQFTCRNGECVARNARCDNVAQCQDNSDEADCFVQATSTNAPPIVTVPETTVVGCTLPEQPTGGSYQLSNCATPCSKVAGDKVPNSSILTYTCQNGYTLKGNTVTVCLNELWLQPPICQKTCPALKSNSVDITCTYQGSTVPCDSAIPGTSATLSCKHSYNIPLANDPAYRELICLDEGIWDRTLFRCLPECGTAIAHGDTLIVDGFTAKLGVFPWHVGIYRANSRKEYEQICGGTLISSNLIVSAAHCFYDDSTRTVEDASNYAVAAGKHYRSWDTDEKYVQKSEVTKIEVASRYFGANGNFAQDISIMFLKTPFTLTALVRPVCMDWENALEREQLYTTQSGKAVGWGKTAEGVASSELQEINLPTVPYSQCLSAVPEDFRGFVTADKFCAGYLNGSSLCDGDSGGGLCFQKNGLWYLRGVVSVSPVREDKCDNNYYTAFTNVGLFREWIRAAYVST